MLKLLPMATEHFYANLPTFNNFIEVTHSQNFAAVPDDWYALITDIVGSTAAINAGRYKDVNLIGASAIAAVLNIAGKLEIPFVFGGDGASILVPPVLLDQARQVLLATKHIADTQFGLTLRVGAVPIATITAAGYSIRVSKLQVSKHYTQANIEGGGLTYATDLVKNDDPHNPYQLHLQSLQPHADFSGLECRWRDIPSALGQTISLLVLATPRDSQLKNQIYENLIQKIREIYGEEKSFHPVQLKTLNLTFSYPKLKLEMKLRAKSKRFWHQLSYLTTMQVQNLIGLALMKFKLIVDGVNWGAYKEGVIATTDYQKFDDMLRMVIAGSAAQTKQLIYYLEQELEAGRLVHGLHISNRALMTCLVYERNGRQVHFVDGADGGYAFAAQELKQRLHRKAANWKTYSRLIRLRDKFTNPSPEE